MRRPIPSTQALACFEASARHESYTRAAQELALTQSAVSRQVIALEEFVGVALFRRTRHGVSLTPAGALYAKKVRGWLQGLERDTLDLMSHQGQGGTVNLAAVPTFATRWLMPRLPLLARQHPDITVHIEVQTRPFLFADTVHDAALYAGTPEQVGNWPGVQVLKLMDEDVVPVCSPTVLGKAAARDLGRAWQPVAPEVLARLPLLQQSTRPYDWNHCCQPWPGRGADSAHAGRGRTGARRAGGGLRPAAARRTQLLPGHAQWHARACAGPVLGLAERDGGAADLTGIGCVTVWRWVVKQGFSVRLPPGCGHGPWRGTAPGPCAAAALRCPLALARRRPPGTW